MADASGYGLKGDTAACPVQLPVVMCFAFAAASTYRDKFWRREQARGGINYL